MGTNVARRVTAVGCVVFGMFLAMAAGALASAPAIYLCVPTKVGAAVTSGGKGGSCKAKTTKVAVPSEEAAQQKLLAILPYVKYEAEGVGKKPTIQVSGANLQLVNGAGKTETVNGTGNLVVGYDEAPGAQTGSHNLVLGSAQEFTSFGSLIAGAGNVDTGPFSDVLGHTNLASERYASVTGGTGNKAIAESSSIGGGSHNEAAGANATVTGGFKGGAVGETSSVTGGSENKAFGFASWASGGFLNSASEDLSSVSGGEANLAFGAGSSVTGGLSNTAQGEYATVSGGNVNLAEGRAATVSGGAHNTASGRTASVSGGYKNIAQADFSSIFGGKELKETTEYGAMP